MPAQYPQLEALPPDEKMLLAAELWSEAAVDAEIEEPDPRIVEILEERMRHFRMHPETASTWEQVKERIRGHG